MGWKGGIEIAGSLHSRRGRYRSPPGPVSRSRAIAVAPVQAPGLKVTKWEFRAGTRLVHSEAEEMVRGEKGTYRCRVRRWHILGGRRVGFRREERDGQCSCNSTRSQIFFREKMKRTTWKMWRSKAHTITFVFLSVQRHSPRGRISRDYSWLRP